uniref:FliM/FliN family flagellar motor switch protein n=1 Tax=Acidobacterium capsulatum TaxID=33075 RepID=A0A7V5CTE0_9BACT
MATNATTAPEEPTSSTALLAPVQEEAAIAADTETASLLLRRTVEERVTQAPLRLEIRLPIRGLRVKDILALRKGAIFETQWPADEDIPGDCGGQQLVWTEFEVIDKKLAVRVTRLA